MTNHPNRRAVYRVSCVNGRFDHIATKRAALARASEIAGAPKGTSEQELISEWGVIITRVSPAIARSVGL
jgi:hypothetical protein